MITRRRILEMTGAAGAVAWSGIAIPRPIKGEGAIADLPAALPQGLREEAVLDALPGKKPLIKLPRLHPVHPDEFTVSQSGGLGCRASQDDRRIRRPDRANDAKTIVDYLQANYGSR